MGAAHWHWEIAMAEHGRTIRSNRAPVLTLWAAVVAERLGFDSGAKRWTQRYMVV
jgi:hypothetical protein